MKKNLVIGCSNGLSLDKDFTNVFGADDHEWINLSCSGMGNRFITSRLFEYVDDIGIPDYVYLQYSGLSRIDIACDSNITVPGYKHQLKTEKRTWIGSGGGKYGAWRGAGQLTRLFAYQYDIKVDDCNYDLSLHEIFRGIELCKILNIPYNWTSYYDYTNLPNERTQGDGRIDRFPDYIDMSNHIGESPLNFAYKRGHIPKDNIHYSRYIGEQFLISNKDKINL